MAPQAYGDPGKASRDIFNKHSHLGIARQDLKSTQAGVEFSVNGPSNNEIDRKVVSSLETKYSTKNYGLTLKEKWNSDNILTGEATAVGSVEGVPFTACTSGPNIIILASNFSRVQQISASSPITSLDCSTDVGKIAAAYDDKMVVFEPISQPQTQQPPQSQQKTPAGVPELDYNWVQTATIESETSISVISFNLEGTRLVAGGKMLQLWAVEGESKTNWQCVWRCKTASTITYLKYSSDGTMFCSAGQSDRLVKIWYESNPTTTTPTSSNNGSTSDNGNTATSNPTKQQPSNQSPSPSQPYPFIYVAHPQPVTGLEWRRTNKYTPRGAVANILITSCRDNIARVWVQTLSPSFIKSTLHFHLAAVIEADCDDNNVNTSGSREQLEEDGSEPQFVVHWVNNKEIHITRSIELLLHDMLIRILRRNNENPTSSSTNSPHSHVGSCSGSENDTDELDYANDDTITAESSKKLWHKLCRKMNKQRALAASGRRDPGDSDDNSQPNNRMPLYSNNNNNGRASPTSLVEEFDKTLESLLKRWQMSDDLLFSINKSDGTLILWQVKYLDGEDTGVFRQVQIDILSRLKSAIPHYDATTMSLNVTAYSPSAYLDVKRAYLAVTSSSGLGSNNGSNSFVANQLSPVDVPEILSINTDSASSFNQSKKLAGGSVCEMKDSASASSVADAEPSIFIVTQHLSGISGLWKLNFGSTYPKVQSVDLVTRITGLPIDPLWLRDGTLLVEYIDVDSILVTKWLADESGKKSSPKGVKLPFSPSQVKSNPYNFEEIKSSLICHLPSVDEEIASQPLRNSSQNESHIDVQDSYRASQMASSINILPQYDLKQLIELLAFGKLQRVKAILNHLVNCLILMETGQDKETDTTNQTRWAHKSRTLSIVAQSVPSFQDSFDIDNPSSIIQQQFVEEIELDYIEVTSIKPLPLYSLLDADTEKPNSGDNKTITREDFSTNYESIMRARSQVDETLDEILGQSTINTLNKQKELKRLASDGPGKSSLTSFNPKKAKLLTRVLTHTHLPGLSNVEQMHLLAVADAVALFDASPEDLNELHESEDSSSSGGVATNIAIDSLDDRGLRFLTAMRQHVYLTRCLPMKQRNELKASGIGNHNIVWAFHSESQDELISLIPCVQRNKPEWSELREFGIGWWLKKLEVLKKLIEKVAQSAYQARQDPLDAALFYLAMKKKTLVCALLRRVNCDKRLLKLFEQDFNDPVNRKKALKNAYALLGLHRFEHAAAFFILAGSIWDAVEVCINNLNDVQLAIVLIRLHDNETNIPNNLRRLLFTEILGSKRPTEQPTHSASNSSIKKENSIDRRSSNAGPQYNYDPKRAHQDPFLRSMAFWKLGDYLSSVHTLLESDVGQQRHRHPSLNQIASIASQNSRRNSDTTHNHSQADSSHATGQSSSSVGGNVSVSASVFNFYLFLKDQPLVGKHKHQLFEENKIKKRTSPVEEEKVHCHRARSLSSGELGFDERGLSRTIKQSSTEFEVLNETTRLVDRYSDEAIAEKERRLFFSIAHTYLETGCPLLALEVLCSEDHLNMSKAQRMKFIACLHILMNELNTLASSSLKFRNQFFEWLHNSVEAMKKICSYAGVYQACKEIEQEDFSSNQVSGVWIKKNEPILRAMLTYCNLHSATENSLITVRLELLDLLKTTVC